MRWRDDGLGVDVDLAESQSPAAVDNLSPGERARLPQPGGRRGDWLRGRAALKALLDDRDTATIAFPHRGLSLTHSAGVAVAARCDGDQDGLGVDFEGWRRVDPRAARFYLHPDEWHDDERGDLLRLWTVKEAVFKATPANREAVLLDYRVADPDALAGTATDRAGRRFRYVSRRRPDGWLTIAVCSAAV